MAIAGLVCGVLLCCAAIAAVGDSRAISLVDEVDGLELNAYLTPNDVEEFKKVRRSFATVRERGCENMRDRGNSRNLMLAVPCSGLIDIHSCCRRLRL